MTQPDHSQRLGLLSLMLMALIQREPETAYGSALTGSVAELMGRKVAGPQIYIALRRLREDGYIKLRREMDDPSGPPLKLYRLTAKGRQPLNLLRGLLDE